MNRIPRDNDDRLSRLIAIIIIAILIGAPAATVLVGISVGFYDAMLKYFAACIPQDVMCLFRYP